MKNNNKTSTINKLFDKQLQRCMADKNALNKALLTLYS